MEYSTTGQLLLDRVGNSATALLFEEYRWSWDEFVRECAQRAAFLQDFRKTERRVHVGVLLDNVPEFLFWVGAAALAGATVVGINPTRRGAELAADIRHTDCDMLVTDTVLGELLTDIDTGVATQSVAFVDTGDYAQKLARYVNTEPAHAAAVVDPSTPLLLLFTSGSTGAPKAVVCSTGRLAALATVNVCGIVAEDVCYCPMPLFHGNALMACWAPALAVGATVALRRKFSASGFLPDVLRFEATFFTYVGRALSYVLAQPEQAAERRTWLRRCFGTEASPRDRAEFERRFGCTVLESYGSSEGVVSIRRTPCTPPGALGPAPDSMDLAIVDTETGIECPRARFSGTRLINGDAALGQIVRRDGAGLFEGYYRNDAAEAQRVHGDWYWTGDLGYRDREGFFYFAGRDSDWLRVDGENFSAAPVEAVLARFDDVVATAVYPVPDARNDDQVMAALQLTDDMAFHPERLAEFLTAQADLGTKWTPRYLRITREIPTTATGKIDKTTLRRQQWTSAAGDTVYFRKDGSSTYHTMTISAQRALREEFRAHGRESHLPEE